MLTQRKEAEPGVEIVEISDEEAEAMLDREARHLFNISGAEFARRWHAGAFRNSTDPRVTQVAMLLPNAW